MNAYCVQIDAGQIYPVNNIRGFGGTSFTDMTVTFLGKCSELSLMEVYT